MSKPPVVKTPWGEMAPEQRDYCRGWDLGRAACRFSLEVVSIPTPPLESDVGAFRRGYHDGFQAYRGGRRG